MKTVVLKFGGSSLSTAELREIVAGKIQNSHNSGLRTVVVLSAMGRFPDPFATDTILKAANERRGRSSEELDLISSTGELYSAITMAALLRSKNLKVKVMCGYDAGICTDANFGNAKITEINTEKIDRALQNGEIVIVTGFQGVEKTTEQVTTLGRGGSDTTATALGAALNSERVEIYTDVDGVMSADPKIYPDTTFIKEADLSEMGEMANEGAKVLHKRSVEIAQKHNLTIFVKNSANSNMGTKISSDVKTRSQITGLIHRVAITDIKVELEKPELKIELLKQLTQMHISIDMINLHSNKLYFAIANSDLPDTERYLSEMNLKYEIRCDVAKISCVGSGMRGIPGVMARIYAALTDGSITIYRTVDSYINISFLIPEKELTAAMKQLHNLL